MGNEVRAGATATGGGVTPVPTPADEAVPVEERAPGEGPVPVDEPVDVHSARAADRDAEFSAFVRHAGPALVRTAWLLTGDRTRAEDLAQQALVRTYVAWPRVRDGEPLAYARRIVANARIDDWRRRRREVLTGPGELPDRASTSAGTADRHADRDALLRALATLTPRQRRIVVLRYLEGRTEAEVAADLGVSLGTVKSTASRSLRALRDVLDPTADDPRRAR